MRPQKVTVSAVATSTPITVNWRAQNFKIGMLIELSAGASLTYSVQHTLDAPEDFTSQTDYNTNAVWLDNDDLSGLTVTEDGNYNFPARAVRLNVTVHSSGTATLTLVQAA